MEEESMLLALASSACIFCYIKPGLGCSLSEALSKNLDAS